MDTTNRQAKASIEAKGLKSHADLSVRESMAAVSAVLNAIPDNVVRMPTSAADVFLSTDPVLSILNRQLLDARKNNATLTAMLGEHDPMMEAISMQLTALEQAYAERMAALMRKREEGRKAAAPKRDVQKKIQKLEANPSTVARPEENKQRQTHGNLWSWIIFAWLLQQASMKQRYSVPRLDAA